MKRSGYAVGYLGLSGSEKLFKPSYMLTYLRVYENVCMQIAQSPDSSHIDAAVDILISFVPDHSEKQRLYALKKSLYSESVKGVEQHRKLSDNEKTSLKRSVDLRVVAEVNEAMSSTMGFSYNRKIGIIGEYGDSAGFVGENDLPADIRTKMMARLQRAEYSEAPEDMDTLEGEGAADAEQDKNEDKDA